MSLTASRAAATASTLALAVLVASCSDSSSSKVLSASTACFYNADPTAALSGNLSDTLSAGFTSPLRFALEQAPGNGTVSIASDSGTYRYQATGSGRGDRDEFRFRVTDSDGNQTTGTVQIVNGQLRIMPVGDSITYGVTSYNASTGDLPTSGFAVGYRLPLYDMLTSNGYQVEMVGPNSSGSGAGLASTAHAGFPGWTSNQMRSGNTGDLAAGRFIDWLTDHTPDAVLLHAGSNDNNTDMATASGVVGLLESANSWRTSNHSLSMLVAQIIKPRADSSNASDPVETHNQTVANYMASDARYTTDTVVDQYAALDRNLDMTPPPGDTTGLHPNSSGYAKMAQTWYDALVSSGTVNKCGA